MPVRRVPTVPPPRIHGRVAMAEDPRAATCSVGGASADGRLATTTLHLPTGRDSQIRVWPQDEAAGGGIKEGHGNSNHWLSITGRRRLPALEAHSGAVVELHRGLGGGEPRRGDYAGSEDAGVFGSEGGVMEKTLGCIARDAWVARATHGSWQAVAAAVVAAHEARRWKAIESAPKFQYVDIWAGGRRIPNAQQCPTRTGGDEWRWWSHGAMVLEAATHWTPIPEPPQEVECGA